MRMCSSRELLAAFEAPRRRSPRVRVPMLIPLSRAPLSTYSYAFVAATGLRAAAMSSSDGRLAIRSVACS